MSSASAQLAGVKRKYPSLSRHDYTLVLFCVLDVELAALRAMLDDIHDDIPLSRASSNIYVFGEFSGHNVVISILPVTGNNHSSTVAAQIREDLPSVRNGLVVGVAGGVPSAEHDIRLGDVVVAEASSTSDAVVQFDRGKHHGDRGFEVTGHLNKPPHFLSALVKKMKAQHSQQGSKISHLINDMLERCQEMGQQYRCPGLDRDQLFEASYQHEGGVFCLECSKARLVKRPARTTDQPLVHYGTIGSSNCVVRDGMERDRLGEQYNIICVEMEAAGLVDQLPCLVVRGVCDYADSHKNKVWQPYAAATAAAYVKELLQAVPPSDFGSLVPPSEEQFSVLKESLRFQGMDSRLRSISQALPQTCEWLAAHQQFNEWNDRNKIAQNHGFLWVKGKPGSGKSTIMKALLCWESKKKGEQHVVSYFFNARSPSVLERSSLGLYRSLTLQLIEISPLIRMIFIERFSGKEMEGRVEDWTAEELTAFLADAVLTQPSKPLVILVDALDEGDKRDIRLLVDFLETLANAAFLSQRPLRICLSSRHYPEITIKHGASLILEDEEGHENDIKQYIYQKLVDDDTAAMEQLRDQIWQKSTGVFLWIVLVVSILNEAYDDGDCLDATTMSRCLTDIPQRLEDLFATILDKSGEDLADCLTTLQWVLYSREQLTLIQLYLAVATVSASPRFHSGDLSYKRIRRCLLKASRGLTEISKGKPATVHFIHETVRDFLRTRGLAQIDPSLTGNVEGVSHAKLRVCCFKYFNSCNPEYCGSESEAGQRLQRLFLPNPMMLSSKYPLLKYAVEHMFEHADTAGAFGESQWQFMQLFQTDQMKLRKWIGVWNTVCWNVRYALDAPILYIMADRGYAHLVRILLEDGLRDCTSSEMYGTALTAACAGGHEQAARLIIESGSDVNLEGRKYKHAIFAAIHMQSKALTDLLLSSGCKVPKHLLMGQVRWCVQQRNSLGLQAVAKIDHQVGNKALVVASYWQFQAGVKLLIESGCDGNAEGICGTVCQPTRFVTAMHAAVASNSGSDILRLLLNAGANVDARDGRYDVALQAACCVRSESAVRLLLDAGADVNAPSRVYGTALQAACRSGSASIIQTLLKAGADVNMRGGRYDTALQAACCVRSESAVRLLLDAGADVNAQGRVYGTALQAACQFGSASVMQILLDAGADINAHGGLYGTALHIACRWNSVSVVRWLLEVGADANVQTAQHGSPLQVATAMSDPFPEVLKMLLEAGADVDAQGGYYGNALQAAVCYGREHVVAILINAEVDVDSRGRYGSALDAARYFRRSKIEQMLVDAGADDESP